jgi:putative hydrolase of the HAD superfamily
MTDALDAVLFDVDGTLCEYRRGTAELLAAAFDRAGVEPFFTATEYEARFGEFVDESDGMCDLRRRCFAAIASDCGREPELGRKVARAYAAERDHANVAFLDGAREALETLDGGYRLAAVTNGAPEMQSAKLDALGVDCFETVVYAGYDVAAKPEPEPFETALDSLGVPADRALYVGNSLSDDVTGAHAAGLDAAWVCNGASTDPDPTPEYVLDSPGELLEVL